MYYYRVKEIDKRMSEYTDGENYFNIHETPNGIDNANKSDLFQGSTIKEAMEHFNLQKIEDFIEIDE